MSGRLWDEWPAGRNGSVIAGPFLVLSKKPSSCYNISEKSVFLPPIWSPDEGAKREAGVSPAQSRCCKLIELKPRQICHCATL